MKIEYLHDFIVFSQCMNYSHAARKLFTTQTSLGNHIHALEHEFGTKLVTHGQNPILTPAGRELVERASEFLAQYQAMADAVRNAGAGAEEVSILVNNAPMGALANLSNMNLSYLMRYTSRSITTSECVESSVRSALANSGADAVACYDCPLDDDVDAGIAFVVLPDIAKAKFALWISTAHPLAAIEHLTWEDIKELKHPLPNQVCRLWANTTRQILAKHHVVMTERLIAEVSAKFFLQIRDDEVQLFDTSFNTVPRPEVSGRILKPIEGPGSESLLYLGYNPRKVSPALQHYLDFIEEMREEQKENAELFGV